MKLYIVCWFFCLFYQHFTSTTSSSCEKTLFYKYIPLYYDTYPRNLHYGYPLRGCNFVGHLGRRHARVIDAASIICSNVSSDAILNYTYQNEFYRQDLVILNSTIPIFPSNSLLTFTTIRKLVLKNLSIEEVSPGAFGRLEVLSSLDLSWNKLQRIPDGVFDNLSTLTLLDLSNNRIDSIDRRRISGLVGLNELYLTGNEITVLQNDVFKDLTVLETLDVSDNPLKAFGNVGFFKLKKLLSKNTHLKRFDPDLSSLTTLSHCDLSGGNLETINFDKFPSMEIINLSHNNLSILDNFARLKSDNVYLNDNNITKLERLPTNVGELNLSNNRIKLSEGTSLGRNSSLKILNLNYNEISEIFPGVFWGLDNLKILKMRNNHIDVLNESTFVNCSSLESVDLSYNKIFSIKSNAFSGVDKLKLLNVSHNYLQLLNLQMLPENSSLSKLYIDHNQIISFDAEQFLYHFTNLKEISLNDNRWSCEILTDITHWLNVKNIKVLDATSSENYTVRGISCNYDKET